jgi:hypothetical protein
MIGSLMIHNEAARQRVIAASSCKNRVTSSVMAGLDPAIHEKKPVDPRVKPGD